ncbi:hypothetical protein [Solibacillus sp. FSL W8-0372]|uniref:hypothetical protein n=1 Tax=Solibacillus sp. FSL W8-0372 TaxID=2921713 RepID=UPI0030D5EC9E
MQTDTVLITEKELIELTVTYGYSGSELTNPHFLEKGFLKQNGTYKSFLKKVESICESWVRLRKKKGQPVMYEITNLYEEALPLEDNRSNNGKKWTEEDLIMQDYIHFVLSLGEVNDEFPRSLNSWAKLFGLPTLEEIDEIVSEEVFDGLYKEKELLKIIEKFKNTIYQRNKEVVSNSFRELEKQNKIQVIKRPIFVLLGGTFSYPSEEEYSDVEKERAKILGSRNVSLRDFFFKPTNEKVIEAKVEVDEMLRTRGLILFYRGYQINDKQSVSYENALGVQQFLKAYSDRLVQLTLQRENNPNYQVNFVEKRFYIYNTLILLRELDYEIDGTLISKYEPTKDDIVSLKDSKRDYVIAERELYHMQFAFSNRVKDEEIGTWGFKVMYVTESKLKSWNCS